MESDQLLQWNTLLIIYDPQMKQKGIIDLKNALLSLKMVQNNGFNLFTINSSTYRKINSSSPLLGLFFKFRVCLLRIQNGSIKKGAVCYKKRTSSFVVFVSE
ncbi:TPA: hypothetical protein QC183_006296 [Bacillus cereus]|nr:hypothetical protein [Bacillus cereus]HDR8338020.1 hypothetical protein [Bacillus cereus]